MNTKVKILKDSGFSNIVDYEDEIASYIDKGYEIKSMIDAKASSYSSTIVLLIKTDNSGKYI
jgi:hypothetical protein